MKKAAMGKQRNVALAIVPSSDNQVRMIRGVMQYAQEVDQFQITKNSAIPYVSWAMLDRVKIDGVIAYAETQEQLDKLVDLKIPAVSLTLHVEPIPEVPVVHSDNIMIGKLAAEHLMSLGVRNFAFVGHFGWLHNRLRRDGFVQALTANGIQCHEIEIHFESESTGELSIRRVDQRQLREGIAALPTPTAILAAHDEFVYEVSEACRALDRSIPFDVSIIGVNDNRLICETTVPQLSSIAQNSERIGYLAAKMVDELIQGKPANASPVLVPPSGLILRRSSEFLAIEDKSLVGIVQYLRERCHHPITIGDIADHFGVGRKTLDKRFKVSLGHPVAEEIRLARIRLAWQLLSTTSLKVVDVALRCGFDSTSGFVRAFREHTGLTPGQIRENASSHDN